MAKKPAGAAGTVEVPTVVEIADAAAARAYLRENVNAVGVDELSDQDAIANANAHQKAVHDDAFAAAAAATEKPKPDKADKGEAAPAHMARVKHSKGATSASFDGRTYEANDKGVIVVPQEAVEPLKAHGFELI